MEQLVRRLTYSSHPLFQNLFGAPPLLLECDPVVHEAIMQRVEQQVYGAEGILHYEQRETSELKRLARRSLAQFLCQRTLVSIGWVRALRRIVFWLTLFPLNIFLLWRTMRTLEAVDPDGALADVVVLLQSERQRSVAEAAFKGQRIYYHTHRPVYLGRREFGFLACALLACPRSALHPEFLANMLRWLSYYAYVVHRFHPKAIAHFFESVASSSLLTAYLREKGIRHINLMHGERLFTADSAFCEFDEFHVWGQHFKKLFVKQHVPTRQLVVTGNPDHQRLYHIIRPVSQPRPKHLLIIHNPYLSTRSVDYLYLLEVLQALDSSWEVRIRRHPVAQQSWRGYIEALNAEPTLSWLGIRVEEETHEQASLEQALARSRVVVGVTSTALIEAWIAGCKVIYLKGQTHRGVMMERFNGSQNVLYLDDTVEPDSLRSFLSEPVVLDVEEDRRVEYISHVRLNEREAI